MKPQPQSSNAEVPNTTPATSASLEALRAILAGQKTSQVYAQLRELWPDGDASEVEIDYALAHLGARAQPVRWRVPEAWCDPDVGRAAAACLLCRRLEFRTSTLGPEGAKRLAALANLRNLTRIVLSHNALTDEGVRALLHSPILTGVDSLYLGHNGITHNGLQLLMRAGHLRPLDTLGLNNNRLRLKSVHMLLDPKVTPALRRLHLEDNPIQGSQREGLQRLARARSITLMV